MSLYGEHNLIDGQIGYSIVPEAENIANDWPKNYIVIATCEADPFCIDVSQINSPIFMLCMVWVNGFLTRYSIH